MIVFVYKNINTRDDLEFQRISKDNAFYVIDYSFIAKCNNNTHAHKRMQTVSNTFLFYDTLFSP